MKPTYLFLAASLTALSAEPQVPPVMAIGSPVPDFALPGIDGKEHKLADFESSKVLCLIFTCNHCPDAVAAAERMEALHQDYKDKGVAVVAVNSSSPLGLRPDELGYGVYGDTFEEMTPFAKENGWTFPYLNDGETQTLSSACGAQSTPHVFIFGEDRKLAYTGRMDDAGRKFGPVEKSYVRDALDAVLAGKPVATPTTRSFGCSTKWAWKKDQVAADQKAWEAQPVTVAKLDVDTAKKLRKNGSGNVRLVNFWSTTCGPCIAEFPELVDTYRRFQNRSFDFVTISLDPPADEPKVQKFLAKQHAALAGNTKASVEKDGRTTNNYLFAGDNPDLLAEAIDSEWTGAQPHSVLISPDGEIVWRHSGQINAVELRRAIIKALEGMP
ncbi:redoxin domain-containing protein [Luteolibacter marinus]|uniref:redoxin domain-containing protein n=1 Tax=Luteolibacter marinus TaxID=2776705 RepID=UPI001866C967|nr:redoxin domain-containing protein [Luteolibacter marinus]